MGSWGCQMGQYRDEVLRQLSPLSNFTIVGTVINQSNKKMAFSSRIQLQEKGAIKKSTTC